MKPSPINEVLEMYETTADSYAEMMDAEIKLPVYSEVLERVQACIVGLSGVVIDTACGSGHMLFMYREHYDTQREIVGIDLSPRMLSFAREQLGSEARLLVGDMRDLQAIESCSAAALLNWYAIHHLSIENLREAMQEWHRVLIPEGHLFISAWEGAGQIDYGEASNIVAIRYSRSELSALAEDAGFKISRCAVTPVDNFPMDAVYLECMKVSQPDKSSERMS